VVEESGEVAFNISPVAVISLLVCWLALQCHKVCSVKSVSRSLQNRRAF
jgi:hypothetical protein